MGAGTVGAAFSIIGRGHADGDKAMLTILSVPMRDLACDDRDAAGGKAAKTLPAPPPRNGKSGACPGDRDAAGKDRRKPGEKAGSRRLGKMLHDGMKARRGAQSHVPLLFKPVGIARPLLIEVRLHLQAMKPNAVGGGAADLRRKPAVLGFQLGNPAAQRLPFLRVRMPVRLVPARALGRKGHVHRCISR